MQCNIDHRGRRMRMALGTVLVLLGVVLVLLGVLEVVGGIWVWVAGAVAVALGGFGMFEARSGWCVARAMGFKTPM